MTIHRTALLAGLSLVFGLAACDSSTDREAAARSEIFVPSTGAAGASDETMLVDLRAIVNPGSLESASVADRDGQAIGLVERVETSSDGTLRGLVIELEGGDMVRATPLQARFDERADRVALIVNVDQLGAVG